MKTIALSIVLCFLGSQCALAVERQIETEQSTFTIHVGKSGLFSVAGHEHTVTAPIAEGVIDDGASAKVSFRVEAARLTVLTEDTRVRFSTRCRSRSLKSPVLQ